MSQPDSYEHAPDGLALLIDAPCLLRQIALELVLALIFRFRTTIGEDRLVHYC